MRQELGFSPTDVASRGFSARLIAGTDVLDFNMGNFAVREYLDFYNDDFRESVQVRKIIADTWIGHKIDAREENWLDFEEKPTVPPGTVVRIAERERVIDGVPHPNWWIRWIRFKVETDKGSFDSNFAASPLKAPSKPILIKPAPKVDSLSPPGMPWKQKK